MRRSIITLLVAFGLLALSSGTASAQANASYPFITNPAHIGTTYSSVCNNPRLNRGVCYWWVDVTATAGATQNSAYFRVLKRSKLCLDTASTGASVQVKETVTPSTAATTYSITPSGAVLSGADCIWLYKGEYWLEVTTSSAAIAVVSIREVPE